jgi:hypothetical protein
MRREHDLGEVLPSEPQGLKPPLTSTLVARLKSGLPETTLRGIGLSSAFR